MGFVAEVELSDFNRAREDHPRTDEGLPLAELLAKSGDADFLRLVAESVLQLIMEADVEGAIGAGCDLGAVPSGRPGATAAATAPWRRGWGP